MYTVRKTNKHTVGQEIKQTHISSSKQTQTRTLHHKNQPTHTHKVTNTNRRSLGHGSRLGWAAQRVAGQVASLGGAIRAVRTLEGLLAGMLPDMVEVVGQVDGVVGAVGAH